MGRPGDFPREIAAAARRHFSWTRDRKRPSQPIRRPIPGKRSAPPNSPRKSPATPGRETPGRRRPGRAAWPSARGAQPPHRRAPRRDPRNGASGGPHAQAQALQIRDAGDPAYRRPAKPPPAAEAPRPALAAPRGIRASQGARWRHRHRRAPGALGTDDAKVRIRDDARRWPSATIERGAPRASATPSANAATASRMTNTSPGRSRRPWARGRRRGPRR